jgi:radical SAM superfamily enzyme YgiQ (UPF0313 family)
MISPKKAMNSIQNLINYYREKTIQIQIFDPLWTYPQWRIKLYQNLIKNGIEEEFWAEVRIDQFSPKEIPFLKNLNFTFAFGLESGSPEMLRIMGKTNNPNKFLSIFPSILSKLDSVGIYVITNILFGHPGETIDHMYQTFRYIDKTITQTNNFIPCISKYMLIPGSYIHNHHNYYSQFYHTKFHYKNHWYIPKCSRISSSMVDPSENWLYTDVIHHLSNWVPNLYSTTIKNFEMKKSRRFIYQRYLNEMIFGSRSYWANNPLTFYNDFGSITNTISETSKFWTNVYPKI